MKHRSPFQQFLSDSGVKITKNALVMGLPYNTEAYKRKENSKTTRNSHIPNKF